MTDACPNPSKTPFPEERNARIAAKKHSMRAYRCQCGAWHLTSRSRVAKSRRGKLTKMRGNQ